jgi:hypothetical protein
MAVDIKVMIGQIESSTERVNKAIGSKNQKSWEEKTAPIRRKIRIMYLRYLR